MESGSFFFFFQSMSQNRSQIIEYLRIVSKTKWSEVNIAQSCSTLCDLRDYTVRGILQAMDWRPFLSFGPFLSPGDFPNPEMEPRSSTLQVDSLPAEPPGKPKNPGVGSLSLLQRIFLTQESNGGLSPTLQVNSLPTELPGNPKDCIIIRILIVVQKKIK